MEGVVPAIIGAITALLLNFFSDLSIWRKVKEKIGGTETGSLSIQHENIQKTITEKTSNIYSKVYSIDRELAFNKGKYESLNLDQRDIKNNIDKLLFQWQNLIIENKELKKEIQSLKEQNNTLINQNAKTQEVNKKMYKELKLAKQILDLSGKSKKQNNNLDKEIEDEWDLEI